MRRKSAETIGARVNVNHSSRGRIYDCIFNLCLYTFLKIISCKTGGSIYEIIASVITTNDFGDGEVLSDLLEQIDSPLSQASADGAYDSFENYELLSERGAKITIPPRENAKIHQHGNCKASPLVRDEIVRAIRKLDRAEWKRQSGYHRRSLAETTMFRCFATLTMTEDFWR
jgi:hypothetical protein